MGAVDIAHTYEGCAGCNRFEKMMEERDVHHGKLIHILEVMYYVPIEKKWV